MSEVPEEKTKNLARIPKYGWKVKLDHEFPDPRDQNLRPSFKQIFPELVPLGLRYCLWWAGKLKSGRKPVIDQFRPRHSKMMYGAPCGGMGSGTIGRGFKGEFCRFQMLPGMYEYHTVAADQFIVTIQNSSGLCLYQSVLGGKGVDIAGAPSSWKWRGRPEDSLYCALYPRAWTIYNITEVGVRIICRQVSPFLPGDYKDSCLPVSCFVFTVENNSNKELKVSVTFTFKNGTGSKLDRVGGVWNEPFSQENCKGVLIHQQLRGLPLTYCIAAATSDDCQVSWCSAFDPRGSGEEVWTPLGGVGILDSAPTITQKTRKGQEIAAAVSSRVVVPPNGTQCLEMSLSWDQPKVQFRGGAKTHIRRYARWFGYTGDAAPAIASHALARYRDWEQQIEKWQDPVLQDSQLPEWFKSAIFNELYYLADGGSVWLEMDPGEKIEREDPRLDVGRWGYLESQEYRMYNTYDVHYYASWALVDLWPRLQLSVQLDMLDFSDREDKTETLELYGGKKGITNVSGAVPHDLGDPEDEPWVHVNSYNIHDVSEWRDLNLKMVIQVWRDLAWLDEHERTWLLGRAMATCTGLMTSALQWDTDKDGLIENSGKPDQTFDSWVMTGPSAYCGGLWLAALEAMVGMCRIQGEDGSKWEQLQELANEEYINKLWNGQFFKFDVSARGENVIMADQLAGYWYSKLTNTNTSLLPKDKVRKSLETIFANNVMRFCSGNQGAVNGMIDGGGVDKSTVQSEEVWTGVTYGLGSLMLAEGMEEEGFRTAEGVYKTVYESIGLGFETPEALYEKKHYRAIGYMRPLSIWAMFVAWKQRKLDKNQD